MLQDCRPQHLAQSRAPVTLTGVFVDDLQEFTTRGAGELTNALNNAPSAAVAQAAVPPNAPPGCYPPLTRASVVMVEGPLDPTFQQPLGEARIQAAKAALNNPPTLPSPG